MNINEQKTALCYFLQIQDSDIFYLKIWIRDKNSLFAPLLTGQYFCCWFSPHPYFMFLLCLLPHSGSILDSQLSWESGKFQLARWSHEVAILCSWDHPPPTHPPTHPPTPTRESILQCNSLLLAILFRLTHVTKPLMTLYKSAWLWLALISPDPTSNHQIKYEFIWL